VIAARSSSSFACLLAQLALNLACKPEPVTQLPEPAPTTTPTPADPDPGTDPSTDPSTDSSTEPPPGTTAVAPATEPPETPPVATTDPVEPTDTPIASAGKEPLPAALHTKIDAKCGNDPGVGTAAKPFNLKTPDGKDISLASHRGKVVLLNFWGTWCKPCLKELPEFDRLYRRYRKHGLVLIAIATDTEPAKVQEFATQRKLAAKLALGGEPLADQYEAGNFPFSFVIDAKGQIRGSYRGYKPECAGKLEQDIRTQLEQLK
jgi:peroxiredoxin